MPEIIKKLLIGRSSDTKTQVFRYLVSGSISFLVDFSVLVVLTDYLKMHYLVSAIFGFLAGLVTVYILNKFWVFSDRKFKSASREFAVFFMITMAALGITEVVLWIATDLIGVHYALSKIIAVGISMVFNFFMRKHFVFSQPVVCPQVLPR